MDSTEINPSQSVAEQPNGATKADTVTIDGVQYQWDQLDQQTRMQIGNLRAVDQEIQRLQMQVAIAQTARVAYANALKLELDKMRELEMFR